MKKSKKVKKQKVKNHLILNLKCGSCRFLNGPAKASIYDSYCAKLGKTPDSESCPAFMPNWMVEKDNIKKIGKMLNYFYQETKDLETSSLSLFAHCISNSPRIAEVSRAKLGFSLKVGQKIFINPRGKEFDFINCWISAYVLYIEGNELTVISWNEEEKGSWVIQLIELDTNKVLNKKLWSEHRRSLIKKGAVNHPTLRIKKIQESELEFLKPSKLIDISLPKVLKVQSITPKKV